ncbi:MAG TPA: universal stress protein [Woeseiaceae bacterium]|nr:universal stress protein [Woeseiaceae bacterium]
MIKVTIPLDGSVLAEQALHHAIAMAKAFPAELTLLRVIGDANANDGRRTDAVDFALERRQAEIYLDKLCDHYRSLAVPFRMRVAEGVPADAITHDCAAHKPDLIVMTRHGAGNAVGFAVGGTAQKVIANTDCSVLLIDPQRAPLHNRYRRILVPVDDSLDSEYVLALAGMIAQSHEASLLLLRVPDEPQLPAGCPVNSHSSFLIEDWRRLIRQHADHRLKELSSTVPDTVPVNTQLLISDDVPFTINAAADRSDADLVIIHAKAPNPDNAWRYGPLVHSLLQNTHRALLIVQPQTDASVVSNFRSALLDEPHRDVG